MTLKVESHQVSANYIYDPLVANIVDTVSLKNDFSLTNTQIILVWRLEAVN